MSAAVALLVGMGPGLSAALARRFAAGGLTVVGLARSPARSLDLAAQIARDGGRLETRAVDAGDFEALAAAVMAVEREVGPIATVIHNAYRATFAPPSAVAPEEVVADFRVNVGAALVAVQAALPAWRARRGGTVLLTGGGLALDPTPWLDAASLAIGKAGLRNLAFSLNRDLAPEGIRVATVTIAGAIAPGTAFDPAAIAERFWSLHATAGPLAPEVVYTGA